MKVDGGWWTVESKRARRYAPRGVVRPIAVFDLAALGIWEYRGDL